MNKFQILALSVLLLLTLRDLSVSVARSSGRWVRAFRMCVWLSAAAAILNPLLPQKVATYLGIDRGADLVLYLSVLCFLWVAFFLYSCHLRVQRQVTQLTRHIAIQEAQKTEGPR
jgi:small membrane protein